MPVCLSVCLPACLSACLFVGLSVCLSNPSCDIPICMTQAAVTLCLVCICLQNLFKNFYGLLSKKRQIEPVTTSINSQESQGRQVKSTYSEVARQAGAYPNFCSMKQLGVSLLPHGRDASPLQGYPHSYTWVDRGNMRV